MHLGLTRVSTWNYVKAILSYRGADGVDPGKLIERTPSKIVRPQRLPVTKARSLFNAQSHHASHSNCMHDVLPEQESAPADIAHPSGPG